MQAPLQHRFVYDGDIQAQIEGAARRLDRHSGDKGQLARIAKENFALCKAGAYTDAAGAQHSLALPRHAINRTHAVPHSAGRMLAPPHAETRVAVAKADTATALRVLHVLGAKGTAALNFANQHHAGGGYVNGARAQEEDLCRLIPTLYGSLKKLRYPMRDDQAHYTHGWLARSAGSYHFDAGPPLLVPIITAAMPVLGRSNPMDFRKRMDAGSKEWSENVRLRIRAVLHAAREEKVTSLILGAFGCGAFGNPPEHVAPLFAEVLSSAEFRGSFSLVVFAILVNKPGEDSNLSAFGRTFGATSRMCAAPSSTPAASSAALPSSHASSAGASSSSSSLKRSAAAADATDRPAAASDASAAADTAAAGGGADVIHVD